ncbi:MAG: MraY family glycosyltransferase [bacterium]|nr:MraY family glycosyltransferase [bacterium]
MNKYIIPVLALSCVLSLLLVNIIKRLAIDFGFHDLPNQRKVHKSKVPTMGGVGLFGATWITMIVLNAVGVAEADKSTLRLLSSSTLFFVIGLIDDVRGVSAKSKFIAQLLAGAFFFLWNKNDLAILFNDIVFTNATLTLFSALLFAVIINSINFIDGLDGLCAGVSLILSSALFFFAILSGKWYLVFLILSIMGSLAGFLFFNFYPAKIFMGDTGSLFLGSMFSMIIMLLSYHMTEAWYGFVILFTYPLLDLSLAVVRRIIGRKNLFAPDRNHIHHILMGKREKHNTVVLLIYAINIIFAGFSILTYLLPSPAVFVPYVIFTSALFIYSLIKMMKNYRRQEDASGQ